ncbi:MAG TPA: CHRD domain-containing protein [Phycisphaerae bacterium]|nr:CHRD domain-containing protein [Phycisphaerae bacterium]
MRTNCLIPVLAVFALTSAAAQGAVIHYQAPLSSDGESNSPGTGMALVDVDPVANTMHVHVTFSGLTSGTTASHIHSPTSSPGTGNAGVATTTPTFAGFPLGVTNGTYDSTLDMTLSSSYNPSFVTANGGTTASAEAALFASIAADTAYLNIHTTNFPGGEILGFLVPVPEPASISLLGATALILLRRRR